jgi:hypothetical protein
MCLDGTDDNEPEMPEHVPGDSPNPNQAMTVRHGVIIFYSRIPLIGR